MSDLEKLIETVDQLEMDELEKLYLHISQLRREKFPRVWVVSPESLRQIDELLRPVQEYAAANMSEVEINAAIDEAIAEVRSERRARNSGQ